MTTNDEQAKYYGPYKEEFSDVIKRLKDTIDRGSFTEAKNLIEEVLPKWKEGDNNLSALLDHKPEQREPLLSDKERARMGSDMADQIFGPPFVRSGKPEDPARKPYYQGHANGTHEARAFYENLITSGELMVQGTTVFKDFRCEKCGYEDKRHQCSTWTYCPGCSRAILGI